MTDIPSGLASVDRRAFERALLLAGFLHERGEKDYGPAAVPILRRLEAAFRGKLYQTDRRLHELRNRAVHHWLPSESFDELAALAGRVLQREDE